VRTRTQPVLSELGLHAGLRNMPHRLSECAAAPLVIRLLVKVPSRFPVPPDQIPGSDSMTLFP
jgi:hypothetical protein